MSYTSYHFLPQTVPSPGCLRFPSLATASVRDILLEPAVLFRVYASYVSNIHLAFLLITPSDAYPPAASAVASPICNGCRANSSGLRPDSTPTSLIAPRARPFLTTLTDLSQLYKERRRGRDGYMSMASAPTREQLHRAVDPKRRF